MWVVAMGFSNAFYAIRETLKNVEIQGDVTLREVYKAWWADGVKELFDSYFGEFRNLITHQGKFDLSHSVAWEIDHDQDTEFPRYSYPYARVVCPKGHTTHYTFPEWIHFCFDWWKRGLEELERRYVAAGGVVALEPSVDWGWIGSNRPLFSAEEDREAL